MSKNIKAPSTIIYGTGRPIVFLAGSIEMGQAEPWQAEVETYLQDLDIIILNPRRDDWDSSWEQSYENPKFREQVEWELLGLEEANLVAMYFSPGTKSPITLLELGLCLRATNLIVCCPRGYWRRGNVEILCRRYDVPFFETLDGFKVAIREFLEEK